MSSKEENKDGTNNPDSAQKTTTKRR